MDLMTARSSKSLLKLWSQSDTIVSIVKLVAIVTLATPGAPTKQTQTTQRRCLSVDQISNESIGNIQLTEISSSRLSRNDNVQQNLQRHGNDGEQDSRGLLGTSFPPLSLFRVPSRAIFCLCIIFNRCRALLSSQGRRSALYWCGSSV